MTNDTISTESNPGKPAEMTHQEYAEIEVALLMAERDGAIEVHRQLTEALYPACPDPAAAEERALDCLVADAPDSAVGVYENTDGMAIVLRHAPSWVRRAAVQRVQGLLSNPKTLQIPPDL